MKILLAEDNLVNIKLATRMLANLGCEVDSAENGKLAIDALQALTYDLIFMDLQMPEMDGLATTRWLFAHGHEVVYLPPIIAMTANTSLQDRENCLSIGMVDFIPKPITMEELRRVIDRWVINPRSGFDLTKVS